MKLIILQFLIFGLATAAFADDLQNFSITTNEEAQAQHQLKVYETQSFNTLDINENVMAEDMRTILKNDEVEKNITSGCAYFEDEDTNKDIEKILQEMESVTGSTNSVSSPPR